METISVDIISGTDGLKSNVSKKKKKKSKSREQGNELMNESYITSQNGKTDEKETERSTNEVQVQLAENDSVLDGNMNGSISKTSKKRRKKKKKTLLDDSCEEKMLDDTEKTTKGDSKPESTNTTSSKKRKKKKEKKGNGVVIHSTSTVDVAEGSKPMNIEEKADVSAVINSCLESKDDDTVEQRDSTDMKVDETMSLISSPKAKKKKKKKRKNKTVEVCDSLSNTLTTSMQSGQVECLESNDGKKTDVKLDDETVSQISSPKAKKKKKKKRKNKTMEPLTTSMQSGQVECMESNDGEENGSQSVGNSEEKKADEKNEVSEEGLSVVKSKKWKGKKKKTSNANNKTEDMEVCDSSSCNLLDTVESVSDVAPKRKKRKRKEDKIKTEDSVTEEKTVEKKIDEMTEVVSEVEVIKMKRKKKKKKTDNIEEKNDISLPKTDGEQLETSLSSTILIQNNVPQGFITPLEDVPRCSCKGTKKLVVFDLNGILADIVQGSIGNSIPDGRVSYRSVFLRPFVYSFLDFCFEKFDVGIWSSRRIGLDYMTNLVMKNHLRDLLFCFGQNICVTTTFKTLDNRLKPLFLKDLRRVWEQFGTCLTCGKRKYDETNTLLVDDSPEKSLCNPLNTGIFPHPYQYTHRDDSALGPEGELRKYLERVADAVSVQKFVAENPFGQNAITETHESWEFYSKVVEAYGLSSTRVLTV